MRCEVALKDLNPKYPLFMMEVSPGLVLVGFMERLASNGGYAQVTYVGGGTEGGHREFVDGKGQEHSFDDPGFKRSEWSPNTLVKPILSEEERAEMEDSALVEEVDAPVSRAEINKKVAAIKDKHAKNAAKPAKVAKGAAKPATVKGEKPAKVAKAKSANACRCGCGGVTGGTFCPGHDARYAGWLKKIVAGQMEFKELPKSLQKEFVDIKGVRAAAKLLKH